MSLDRYPVKRREDTYVIQMMTRPRDHVIYEDTLQQAVAKE